ncbi:MAG: hypothetical protein M1825_000785 [Sarcosagium campestre]|nr:MAG: hypothetical protein M1825_000785 [Sarcosagium campestre]
MCGEAGPTLVSVQGATTGALDASLKLAIRGSKCEQGARATEVAVEKTAFTGVTLPTAFRTYYNGGGVFVDAAKFGDRGIEVLASFTKPLAVDGGEGDAAIIYCKVGDGAAILTGPHPEFAPVNLDRGADGESFSRVVDDLLKDDEARIQFLKASLAKLGLSVSQEQNLIPSLSRLHLSSAKPSDVTEMLVSLQDAIVVEDGEEFIKGGNDTFHLHRPSTWSTGSPKQTKAQMATSQKDTDEGEENSDAVVKRLQAHETEYPGCKETPYFNHHAYYSNLKRYQTLSRADAEFGRYLLYGEVVTSTNTMLESNIAILRHLPTGFAVSATIQVAGRGRGSNVWMSPPGSMVLSVVIRHPVSAGPVVFVQYLAALAVVQGIKSYDPGYENVPVKLKWPNDIYAEDPSAPGKGRYVKIGGILVNSSFSGKEYLLVVGIGVNTTNALPTTSLNAILPPTLAPFTIEKLLARILTSLSMLHATFLSKGVSDELLADYYANWLHTDQIVTLEAENGVRARIKGISKGWGLLRAEELGWEDRPTGKVWELQSDSNSFDFFKGLVKKKA